VEEELVDDRVQLSAMLSQESPRLGVTLVCDPPNFFVHGVEKTVGDAGHARIPFRRQDGQRADAFRHAPSADHRAGNARDGFQVAPVVTMLKISCSAAMPPSAPMIRPRR
jgi:hypothetical protein